MKVHLRVIVAHVSIVAILSSGTGCYTVRTMQQPIGPERYAFHRIENAVHVGIQPLYYSDREGEAAETPFDVNLIRKRMVAVRIEARKSSDDPVQILTHEIKLQLPDGSAAVAANGIALITISSPRPGRTRATSSALGNRPLAGEEAGAKRSSSGRRASHTTPSTAMYQADG